MSLTPGLGEDDDRLLDDGEVDMRAVIVASGVMEFELLRLPPQAVGPWTIQQGGQGRVGCALHHIISHIAKYV